MRVAVLIAALAAGLGTVVETCLYGRSPGFGWILAVASCWAAVGILARRLERTPPAWVRALWLAPALMAASLAVYDAHVVQGAAPVLCGLSLVLCTYWSLAGPAPLESFSRWAPAPLLLGTVRAFPEVRQGLGELDLPRRSDAGLRVLKGLALAVPMVALFGLLFASSDRVWSDLATEFLRSLGVDVGAPALRVALLSVLLLGFLRAMAFPREGPPRPVDDANQGDPLVLSVFLGAVNLLFASFLAVQARYLFAGRAAMAIPDLTWAEYVHQGFFELVAATLLVLMVVCAVFRESNRSQGGGWPLALSILLILQTYGVASSAAWRLVLYMDAYGLTVLRLYVAASMGGICLLLALVGMAAATRRSLAWLASRTAFATLLLAAGLFTLDVEGFVARTNVAHPGVDLGYLATLSADAVPAVATLLSSPDPGMRIRAREALDTLQARRLSRAEVWAWQSFNLSRQRAAEVLGSASRPLAGP